MKPGTILEKRVETLSESLKGLTSAQSRWGFANCIPHYCTYRTRTHLAHCVDCGHTWKTDSPKRCPHCGAKLTVMKNTRQRRFIDRAYYCLLQKHHEFNVVRIFYVYCNRKKGVGVTAKYTVEVLQHWIDDTGTDTIRARNLTMFPYYRYCPFSIDSSMSLKRSRNGYYDSFYHIIPDKCYPRHSCTDKLRRNGFVGRFNGLDPSLVVSLLLSDNKFETLWKTKQFDFARKYMYNGHDKVIRYWRQIMLYHKFSYQARDIGIWLDYLDLLVYFGKDLHNPKYLFPEDLDKEHDALVRKKAAIEEQKELERRRLAEVEKLEILAEKVRVFDFTVCNDNLFVVVLKTLEDYKTEGKLQHHCVYSNAYYGKKDSIVLSARLKAQPQKPVETIEVSLLDGRILQCYGRQNSLTQYHQEIMDLVNRNTKKYIISKNRKYYGTVKQSRA